MPEARRHRHAPDGLILAMACVAQFMVVLDVSIVNIALPRIRHDLAFSVTGVQWVVNAYVITFAGFLLLGGRAGDIIGRRRVYLAGLSVFTLASVGAGFSATAGQLVAARAIQGLGGAILSPVTLTIIVTTFHGARLPRAIGAWSAVAGAGGAVGTLLGGVIVSELNWRWIFFINVPLGFAAGAVALAYLRELRNRDAMVKLDWVGALLATIGLGALVYGIINTTTAGWTSYSTASWLIGGVVALIFFLYWEVEIASHPVLPLRIFRSRSLTGANLVMLLFGGAMVSIWYFLTFYIQDVLGFSPLKTGFAFAPMSVGIIVGAQVSSRLVVRSGVRPLVIAGTLASVLGYGWLSMVTAHSDYLTQVLPAATLCSLAMGLLLTPLATAATSHIDRAEAGLASGVLNTARQFGGSIGLAALTTAAASRANQFLHPGSGVAQTAGDDRAFLICAAILAAALVSALIIPAGTGRHRGTPAAPVPVEP